MDAAAPETGFTPVSRRIAAEARALVQKHLSRPALRDVLADRLSAHEAGR